MEDNICESINIRIKEFKNALLNEESYTIDEIIHKHLIFGTPYIFAQDEDGYYGLKKQVANFFAENQRNIFMCGSAKLGFSISPGKLWRPIDGDPTKDSDIDIVIVSDRVFDKYWKSILEYKDTQISYNSKDKNNEEFLDYFFKGWLRPDKFPFMYKGADEWFEFFRSISYKKEYGSRKITAAIYREEYFFMKYHNDNLKGIRTILKGRKL